MQHLVLFKLSVEHKGLDLVHMAYKVHEQVEGTVAHEFLGDIVRSNTQLQLSFRGLLHKVLVPSGARIEGIAHLSGGQIKFLLDFQHHRTGMGRRQGSK